MHNHPSPSPVRYSPPAAGNNLNPARDPEPSALASIERNTEGFINENLAVIQRLSGIRDRLLGSRPQTDGKAESIQPSGLIHAITSNQNIVFSQLEIMRDLLTDIERAA